VARDAQRLDLAARTHRERYGVAVEVLTADLATDRGITDVENRLADGVDLLVNNAGFGQQGDFLTTQTVDELAMLRLHCEAVLRLTKAALPGMLQRGRGQVISVPGTSYKVLTGLAKVLPRTLTTRLSARAGSHH